MVLTHGRAFTRTSDGGYVAVGETFSHDGDVLHRHGHWDIWVIKFDSNGDLVWQNTWVVAILNGVDRLSKQMMKALF